MQRCDTESLGGLSMSPTVGVVIPCKNEIATIAACLRSVRAQGPAVTRVVVVDNGSTDGSAEVAAELADLVIALPGARISTLRNTGAQALGDVDAIAFVDADCVLDRGWLAAALPALVLHDVVGSRTTAPEGASWVARRWATIENVQAHGGSLAWSQHLLVRAATFRRLGGFDEQKPTGEDSDFSLRVREAGGSVALVDGMVAVHHGFPSTVSAFLRRERWHTSTPGWYARMSRRSRALVASTAVWGGVGVAAAAVAPAAGPRPVTWWLATTAVGVVGLGAVAGTSLRHAAPDGALMALWAANRASRLPGELGRAAA
jgi:glycosyltransferase involved in cell wall biosynthesis